MRIHHCYADGIALIQVMLSMTDADRAGKRAGPVPPPPKRSKNDPDDPLAMLLQPMAGTLKFAMKTGATLIEKGLAIWHDPAKAVGAGGARQCADGGNREAGDDGRGFAHDLQGEARHREAGGVG